MRQFGNLLVKNCGNLMSDDAQYLHNEPLELPIESELDLHSFRPQDVKSVVVEYLEACRARGILEVRIVHGKGIGQLRQTVQSVLAKVPFVESYAGAGLYFGGSGATMVKLRPPGDDPSDPVRSPIEKL